MQALADQYGVGQIFSIFIEAAKSRGFGIDRRPSGVALRKPAQAGKRELVLSLFLDKSDAGEGINTGMHTESLGIAPDELSGVEAPRAGYLNTNRFVRDQADIAWLLERALAS